MRKSVAKQRFVTSRNASIRVTRATNGKLIFSAGTGRFTVAMPRSTYQLLPKNRVFIGLSKLAYANYTPKLCSDGYGMIFAENLNR